MVPAPSIPGIPVAYAPSVAFATKDCGVSDVITELVSVGVTSSIPVVVTVLEPVLPYHALPLASTANPSGLLAPPLKAGKKWE